MAVRQAKKYGHSDKTELGLLAVHGLLHLLGWDHSTAAQLKEMSRLTIATLALSGLRTAAGRL
jgi:probable rRNA maturation factor